jgi:hypothetical protein
VKYEMTLASDKAFNVGVDKVFFPIASNIQAGDKISFGFKTNGSLPMKNESDRSLKIEGSGAEMKRLLQGNDLYNHLRVGSAGGESSDSPSEQLRIANTNKLELFGGSVVRRNTSASGSGYSSYIIGVAGLFMRPHYFGTTDVSNFPIEKCYVSSTDRAFDHPECRRARCRGMGREIFPNLTGWYNPNDTDGTNCQHYTSASVFDNYLGSFIQNCDEGPADCRDNLNGDCSNPTPELTDCIKNQCQNNGGWWYASASGWDDKCRAPGETADPLDCEGLDNDCDEVSDVFFNPFFDGINDINLKNNLQPVNIISSDPSIILCNNSKAECSFTGIVGSASVRVCLPAKKFLSVAHGARGVDPNGQIFNDIANPSATAISERTADMSEACSSPIIIEVEADTPGLCNPNRAKTHASSATDWPAGSGYCTTAYGKDPDGVTLPAFPAAGATVTWKCLGSNNAVSTDDVSCSATKCPPIDCVDIGNQFCQGQTIPNGCGGTCLGGLECANDSRCCNGGWIEIKPN